MTFVGDKNMKQSTFVLGAVAASAVAVTEHLGHAVGVDAVRMESDKKAKPDPKSLASECFDNKKYLDYDASFAKMVQEYWKKDLSLKVLAEHQTKFFKLNEKEKKGDEKNADVVTPWKIEPFQVKIRLEEFATLSQISSEQVNNDPECQAIFGAILIALVQRFSQLSMFAEASTVIQFVGTESGRILMRGLTSQNKTSISKWNLEKLGDSLLDDAMGYIRIASVNQQFVDNKFKFGKRYSFLGLKVDPNA